MERMYLFSFRIVCAWCARRLVSVVLLSVCSVVCDERVDFVPTEIKTCVCHVLVWCRALGSAWAHVHVCIFAELSCP